MGVDSVYGPYGPSQPRVPEGPSATQATVEKKKGRLTTGPEQPRLRMKQRLARFGAGKSVQYAVLEPLFRVVRQNHPQADLALIERAYQTAEHYHRGQTRKSGDPYITHPLAVATILAELGMTEPTLCAALLHDTVEDTSYTVEQLTADFGAEIAQMVDGVTKLDKVTYGDSAKAETIRKMVIAMSRDIRVLVIKLADRLHNMRTLGYLRLDKQERIARETLEIYAPLAHRLGMNTLKWELEDLSFSTLEPKVYDEIVQMVAESQPRREKQLREVIDKIKKELAATKLEATVYGRPKHYYSIYQKMVVRGRDFSDIYDLVGLRILVDTPRDCYAALGVIHVVFKPLPGRFKDYIAMPKYNMYQSLHTTVLGPGNKPVEFQIRTHEMHQRAEYGVAAHWKYKQNPTKTSGSLAPEETDLKWVHQLNELSRENQDPSQFLDDLRYEINSSEVYVFTPRGDVIALPSGATPVDFAYAVHTEVGHHCVGARINGKLVPLESVLNNGDQVVILTSKAENAGPSRDWLSFVSSPRAKSKIRQYFSKERREEAIEAGKDALAKQMRKTGLPLQKLLTLQHLTAVASDYKLASVNSLYAAVGEGSLHPEGVVKKLMSLEGGVEEAAEESLEDVTIAGMMSRSHSRDAGDSGIVVHGQSGLWVKLAKCCTPLPGDEILGFITRGAGVSVHRTNCTNAKSLLCQPERIVEVSWAHTATHAYLVAVQVEGLDRPGILSDVTRTFAEQSISLSAANVHTTKERIFKAKFTFEFSDPKHLQHVLAAIQQVRGIYDVYRVRQ